MVQCHDYLMKGIVHLQIQSEPTPPLENNNTILEEDQVIMCLSNSSVITWKIGKFKIGKEFKISSQKKKQSEGQKSKSNTSVSFSELGEQAEASLFTSIPSLSNYNNVIVSKVKAGEKRFIVVGGSDCTIRVLDYETGEVKASFSKANRQPILALNLFGDKILSASDGVYVIQYQDVKEEQENDNDEEENALENEFEEEKKKTKPKVKLSKEEERKREKELKKQYQKKKKPKDKSSKSASVTKPTLTLVKNFRHNNAGLVTSVNIHKGGKSSLLLITSHSENSVRLWDYENENVLLVIRGDYCSPVFSSFLSFKGYGKSKTFDICSINDNFENVYVWNPKTHDPYPTIQFQSNTVSTVEDILFRKRSSHSNSSNILIPDRDSKSNHFFLMSIFQFNYSIPFQIENNNISSLGRRSSEIGLYEQYVTLEPIHKKEIPPLAELKKNIMNSPSSYLLDEVSLVGNSHLTLVFSEIIHSVLSQMKPGKGKDQSFEILHTYDEIIDREDTKTKYLQQKKLSYTYLMCTLMRLNMHYFWDTFNKTSKNFISNLSEQDPTALTRLFLYLKFSSEGIMVITDILTMVDKMKEFLHNLRGNVSIYHSYMVDDLISVLDRQQKTKAIVPSIDRDFFKTLHHMVVTFRSNFTKKFIMDNIYNSKEQNILVEKDVVPYLFGVGKKNIMKIQQQSGATIYISGRDKDKHFEPRKKEDSIHNNKNDKKKGDHKNNNKSEKPKYPKEKKKVQYDFSKFSNVNIKGDIKQVDLAIALIDMVINNFFDKNKLNRRNPPITKLVIDHDTIDVANQYFQFVPYSRLPLSIKFINVKRSSLRIIPSSIVESFSNVTNVPKVHNSSKLDNVTFGCLNTFERSIYFTNEKEVSFFTKKSYSKELMDCLLKPVKQVNEFKEESGLTLRLSLGKLFFYQLPNYIESNSNFIQFSDLVNILNREIESTSQEVRDIISGETSNYPSIKNDFKFSFDDNLSKQHQATITSKLSPTVSQLHKVLSIEMIDKQSNQFIQLNMALLDSGVKLKSVRIVNSPIMNMFHLNLKENNGTKQECDYLLSASRSSQLTDIEQYPNLFNFVSLLEFQSSKWNLSQIIEFTKDQFSSNEGDLYNSFYISNMAVKHKFIYKINFTPMEDGISSFEISPINNNNNTEPLLVNLTFLQYHCSQHSTVTRYQWKLNIKRQIPAERDVSDMDIISLLDFVNILTE
ncbi:predicted protein [Naegleria gruberi]|uniref:Predicted protein n=1 Tax=Naegleria gruberi TaxID=5762 RepID=D2V4L3_NAEGR|nr:uncharacterized protein NAEGRDRAFT_57133 [Naegleria gruberi]EFC47955.1 predicted protein [Naegleria gruberi]|eukprot:XP_002680699.1 predicted protein [Naegleria gruberi strain NEG-M]